MKRSSKKHQYKIIGIIIMIGFFIWSTTQAKTIDMQSFLVWIDMIEEGKTDNDNFNAMLVSFCSAIKDYKEIYGNIIYDSSQSLFVYYICKYKDAGTFVYSNKGFSNSEEISYLKFEKDNEGESKNKLEQSLPSFYKETEDYTQELFDKIIASYTNIYQANIYGFANNPDKTTEEIIHEKFSKTFFKRSNKENDYIQFCSTENQKDTYPKTCKTLKEYFYVGKNLINGNWSNYLNDQNIYAGLKKTNCTKKSSRDIIACWIFWNKIEDIVHPIYNELMMYTIFVEYYSYLLQSKPNFRNRDEKDFQKKIANNQNRIQKMISNVESSRKAIETTIKKLKEIQYTLPIHIWFLMYSESIYELTTNMNKTLTPIYTLHDILRNVQNPN